MRFDFILHWPQIVYLCIIVLVLFRSAHNHGKEKYVEENFFWRLAAICIAMFLLYMGGFFTQGCG